MSKYVDEAKDRETTAMILDRLAFEIASDPMEEGDGETANKMLEASDRLRAGEDIELASLFSPTSGAREAHGGNLCPQCLGATRVCSRCERPMSQCGCVDEGENGEGVCGYDPVICGLCGGSGAEA